MKPSTLHPNAKLVKWHFMCGELSFMMPIIVMFAQWRGVTFSQFMAIQALFAVALLVLTPLVSPLADKYGRRPAAIIGSGLWLAGHVVILLGYGWQSYAFAEILLGLGFAASRPALEAIVYDSLAHVGREDAHFEALTEQTRALSYAGAVAMALGGWMYLIHPTVPVIATVLSNAAMVWVAFKVKEVPYRTSIADKVPTYREMVQQVWVSLSAQQVRWLVILPGLISGSTITLFWSVQPSLTAAGVGAGVSSILFAGYFAARGWFAGKCKQLAERFTARQCFLFCIIALAGGFAGVALLPWWLAYVPFVLGSGFTFILASMQGKELVHRHTESSVRSTAMGACNFVSRIIGTATLTSCSLLQPWLGLQATLLVIGTVMVTLALASLTRLPEETDHPTESPRADDSLAA